MSTFKIIALLLALLFGAYSIEVARGKIKRNKEMESVMQKRKSELTEKDYAFMRIVLNGYESLDKTTIGNSPKSLVVKDSKIVGNGWSQSKALVDPTAHSEMNAIKEAYKSLGPGSLEGCVLYSATQPCPMCLSLLYLTNVERVIYMAPDPELLTDKQRLNQSIYKSLMNDVSERTIPEVALRPQDLNGSFLLK